MEKTKSDTIKCTLLSIWIENEYDDNVWPAYNDELEKICKKNLQQLNTGTPLYNIFNRHLASVYINKGYLKKQQGEIPVALNFYYDGLKIFEELKDKKGKSETLNNIGFIYKSQEEHDKALECFKQCYDLFNELGDKNGISIALNNMGVSYQNKAWQESDPAKKNELLLAGLEHFRKSLKINEGLKNKRGIAQAQYNVGYIYLDMGDTTEALKEFEKSLAIRQELNDKKGLAQVLNTIGEIAFRKNDIRLAKKNSETSLRIALESKFAKEIESSSKTLSKIYAKTGDWKAAYEMNVLYRKMNDSITNQKNKKDLFQKQFQYQYEKKAAADSVRVAAEKDIIAAERKQERTQRLALYGGLVLVLVFSGFIFNRFKTTQKQNRIIEKQKSEVEDQKNIILHQKELVDEKQKEIVDSITYARRIQAAMLTSEKYISKYLNEYFIYYKPKDIVSGDFYWAVQHAGKFFFVTADCTGHGVPGAFMSLLNISFLNENIIEKNIIEPAAILNEQRNSIIKALNPGGSEESKDGMDCILCCFDLDNLRLDYAAANNGFYIVRDGNLIEMQADKMPVGKSPGDDESFTSRTIQLQKGDMVYTLTDGLPDQFGGPKGKKFKYKQLEEMLLHISRLPVSEQKMHLNERFESWIGRLEQVDDVCIIGIRV